MATTWNPSDKDAAITLSNGNLTAAQGGASSAWRSVRATDSHTPGKYFFEVKLDVQSTNGAMAGLATSGASLTNFPGSGATGVGWQFALGSGGSWYNGSQTFGVTDVLSVGQTGIIAWDGTSWWTYAPTAARWNGSSSNSPVSNVGGLSTHSLTPLFPMFSGFRNSGAANDQVTANFGATAFVNTSITNALVSGGFTPWGGVAAVGSSNFFFGA